MAAGLLIYPATGGFLDAVLVAPPLTSTDAEIDELVAAPGPGPARAPPGIVVWRSGWPEDLRRRRAPRSCAPCGRRSPPGRRPRRLVEDLHLDVAGVAGLGRPAPVTAAKSMCPSPIIPRASRASGGSGVIQSHTW